MDIAVIFTAGFWAMGGHGFFVWMAYGFTFAALIALAALALGARARAERALAALEPDRRAGRPPAAPRESTPLKEET